MRLIKISYSLIKFKSGQKKEREKEREKWDCSITFSPFLDCSYFSLISIFQISICSKRYYPNNECISKNLKNDNLSFFFFIKRDYLLRIIKIFISVNSFFRYIKISCTNSVDFNLELNRLTRINKERSINDRNLISFLKRERERESEGEIKWLLRIMDYTVTRENKFLLQESLSFVFVNNNFENNQWNTCS